jgi:heme/copper-type cytochrome/quinol oxidase subunit 2
MIVLPGMHRPGHTEPASASTERSAVLAYVLLAVLAVVVIGLLAWSSARSRRGDETERFSKARELTREWSRGDDEPPAR